MKEETIRRAVRLLGAQGGRVAAERMTKAERTERAKKAAAARWGKPAPKAAAKSAAKSAEVRRKKAKQRSR